MLVGARLVTESDPGNIYSRWIKRNSPFIRRGDAAKIMPKLNKQVVLNIQDVV